MVNDVHLYMYTSKCLNRRTLPSDLLDLYVPMFIGRTRSVIRFPVGAPSGFSSNVVAELGNVVSPRKTNSVPYFTILNY